MSHDFCLPAQIDSAVIRKKTTGTALSSSCVREVEEDSAVRPLTFNNHSVMRKISFSNHISGLCSRLVRQKY